MAAHLRRTCICCRKEAHKAELLRFVVQQGKVVFDAQQKLPGRGAYVHPTPGCMGRMAEVKRWRAIFGRPQDNPDARPRVTSEDLTRLMEEVRSRQ